MNLVLIGAGQRGMIYAQYAREKGHRITAIAEPDDLKRSIAGEELEVPRASEADNEIEIMRFSANGRERYESEIIRPEIPSSGHGGGDSGIVEDFLELLEGRRRATATDVHESVESHMMACAAEESRITGTVVRIEDFRKIHARDKI